MGSWAHPLLRGQSIVQDGYHGAIAVAITIPWMGGDSASHGHQITVERHGGPIRIRSLQSIINVSVAEAAKTAPTYLSKSHPASSSPTHTVAPSMASTGWVSAEDTTDVVYDVGETLWFHTILPAQTTWVLADLQVAFIWEPAG